jgi:hypothetical protein
MTLGFDYKMPWLERKAFLQTFAPYTTGTVAATQGSTTLTGTSTLWNTNNAWSIKNARKGGHFVIDGGSDIYDVVTVTSDTAITITPAFNATTVTTATYIYFEDTFALASDFLRPIDHQTFSPAMDIALIGRNELRKRYPRRNISGRPTVSAMFDDAFNATVTPVRKLILYPYPDTNYVIPYAYITSNIAVDSSGVGLANMSATTDEPNLPLRYRHALVFHALYHWYRDKKDDARSQEAKAEYTDIMLRIAGDQEIGAPTRAQIQPRMGSYHGAAARPYGRRGSRSISTNNRFDRFED